MWKDVKLKRQQTIKMYGPSSQAALYYDWNAYMDLIAEEIGCKPDISKQTILVQCYTMRV